MAVKATDCPCTDGFQEHVAEEVADFDAHPPIVFPLTMNFTFPAVLTEAVIFIVAPLATVTTPPAREIEMVAALAVTVSVDDTEIPELKFVVSVGVSVAVKVVVPCPTTVIVLPDTDATPVFELEYANVPEAFEVGGVTVYADAPLCFVELPQDKTGSPFRIMMESV